MRPVQAGTSDRVCLDVLSTATDFTSTKSVTMCRHISRRRYACTLIERDQESSRLRASSVSKQVSALGPLSSRRLRARARTA